MACSTDFIEALCDTLAPLGEVRSRKMMTAAECCSPYPGAKEAYFGGGHEAKRWKMLKKLI